MKAYMDQGNKIFGVLVVDVVNAGHLGYEFAKQHPDLTKEGWVLYYYDSEEELRVAARGREIIEVGSYSKGIAEAIANACPSCGQQRP